MSVLLTRKCVQGCPAVPGGEAAPVGSDLAAVRAWAKDNGFEVSERGRISQKVTDAYSAAH